MTWRHRKLEARLPFSLRVCFWVLLAGLGGVMGCSDAPDDAMDPEPVARATGPKPNVVWILLDACSASHLSCYGYERETSPNIDALARDGIVFDRAYAQSFHTRDSVPMYMTGRYFAVPCMGVSKWQLLLRDPPPEERLFSEIARENGYRTVMVSAHPFITPESRLSKSFDQAIHVRGAPYSQMEHLVEQAVAALDDGDGRPLFLYVHALDTHFPHYLKPPYDTWVDPNFESPAFRPGEPKSYRGNNFTSEEVAHLSNLHDGSLLQSDAGVGTLVETMRARRLLANTVFVIGSDHGEVLGEDGATVGHGYVLDEVMRVPLILSGLGVPKGERFAPIVENVDIVPTLVDLLGLQTSASFHGRPLVPYIERRKRDAPHEFAFAVSPGNLYALVSEDYTYHRLLSGAEELWSGAHSITSRVPAADVPEATLAGFRRHAAMLHALELQRDRLPLREPDMPFYETIDGNDFADPRRMLSESSGGATDGPPKDARWTMYPAGIFNDGWSENAPPLALNVAVPNANYAVQLEMFSGIINDRRGSALSIRVQDETEFRTIRDESGRGFNLLELGEYTVTNGSFRMDILPAIDGVWAGFKRLRFVPMNADRVLADSLDDAQQRQEAIRALGYVD